MGFHQRPLQLDRPPTDLEGEGKVRLYPGRQPDLPITEMETGPAVDADCLQSQLCSQTDPQALTEGGLSGVAEQMMPDPLADRGSEGTAHVCNRVHTDEIVAGARHPVIALLVEQGDDRSTDGDIDPSLIWQQRQIGRELLSRQESLDSSFRRERHTINVGAAHRRSSDRDGSYDHI
jgi:hypothetical protein